MWVDIVITVFLSVLASSGFWAYLQTRVSKNTAYNQLLRGLAHDRVVHVAEMYIKRGWISSMEYDDFMKYLYEPYKAYGGNGVAERLANEVSKLPIYSDKNRIEKKP